MMLEFTLSVTDQDELDELYPRIKALLPKAQVKVTQPAPVPATQPAPVPATHPAPVPATQPAPVPATQPAQTVTQSATPTISMETVRAKLSDLSRSGKNEQVRALIAGLGYSKFTEVPPERYGELMTLAEGL